MSLPPERNNNSFVAMKEPSQDIDDGQRLLIADVTSGTSSVRQMAVEYCCGCTRLGLLSQTTSFTNLYADVDIARLHHDQTLREEWFQNSAPIVFPSSRSSSVPSPIIWTSVGNSATIVVHLHKSAVAWPVSPCHDISSMFLPSTL